MSSLLECFESNSTSTPCSFYWNKKINATNTLHIYVTKNHNSLLVGNKTSDGFSITSAVLNNFYLGNLQKDTLKLYFRIKESNNNINKQKVKFLNQRVVGTPVPATTQCTFTIGPITRICSDKVTSEPVYFLSLSIDPSDMKNLVNPFTYTDIKMVVRIRNIRNYTMSDILRKIEYAVNLVKLYY